MWEDWLGEWALKDFSEQKHGREFAYCQKHTRQRDSLQKNLEKGKTGFVWYNKSKLGNGQRCFRSTSEIEDTFPAFKEFRNWSLPEKDKQISDYRVIIIIIKAVM